MSIKKHVDLDTLANVISAIPSNIFLKDTDLKYVFSSHIWEQVDNGGSEDFDIYGKTDRDIRKDTANLDNVEKSDRRILETGIGTRYTIKSEVDGHIQHLELVKEPVRDNDGNIIGIVGLINDVTAVTEEMSEMLDNEKAYRVAMKKGAHLTYEVNLTLDLLADDLNEMINGKEINLLDIIGLESPCRYSDMVKQYADVLLYGDCIQEYVDFHNVQRFIDLYNNGERHIIKEFELDVKGIDGEKKKIWAFETILLMRNKKGEVVAFFIVDDLTENRMKEEEVMRQLEENVKEAERVANMKSDFLANMSHEIRTPMNAVIGMAELALREDLPEAAREYINQIKSSGNALLGIINDILDFSKIDSGKMDIIPDNYNPVQTIHDVSNVLMNRINEKELELVGHINPELPTGLLGDDIRIRQIIINLANNAIKFTHQGYVRIDIDFEKTGEDEIILKTSVTDTGIGIKDEDIDKIFVSFQQVDSKRNRNIEGTGLGLAICSQLVELMGGTISVSSEYGKGSVFSFDIPQKVTDWTPAVRIKDKEDKVVIGYWSDDSIHDQVFDILDMLDIENASFNDIDVHGEKARGDFKGKRLYVITNQTMYDDRLCTYVDQHAEIEFIVFCDQIIPDEKKENVLFIKKPVSSIGIGMALNNELFHSYDNDEFEFDFIAPEAKVLIVDDSEVNLAVAEGLIEPLKMQVTTAGSGKKALEILETDSFDIVFMDHMMPELDGVETTRIIRRLHPELEKMPVIALTANAVNGAREMFIAEGMNDFVAKPIEMKKFVSKIHQWLPKGKIQKGDPVNLEIDRNTAPEEKLSIADFDVDAAVALIGNQKLYLTILEKYFGNMKAKAEIIKSSELAEDISTYTIEVHALKSASKQIGAMELSAMAAELEGCGNASDISSIHEKTDALLEKYMSYFDVLKELFRKDDKEKKPAITVDALLAFFDRMTTAAEELDLDSMEAIIAEMDCFSYGAEAINHFEGLKEATESIDIDSIDEIITAWKQQI